jgi:hypothetical protein
MSTFRLPRSRPWSKPVSAAGAAVFALLAIVGLVGVAVGPAGADPTPGPTGTQSPNPCTITTTPGTAPPSPTPGPTPGTPPPTTSRPPIGTPAPTTSRPPIGDPAPTTTRPPTGTFTPPPSPTRPSGTTPPPSPTPVCPGLLTGRLTDGGVPVADAVVDVQFGSFPGSVGLTRTDATGTYQISLRAGGYRLRFVLPGGMVQFHPQQTTFDAAAVITVNQRLVTVVNESVVPHGSLAGRISPALGAPAANATVMVFTAAGQVVGTTNADANGDYVLPYLPAGELHASVVMNDGSSAATQWFHQRRRERDADPFTVVLGQRTVVNERLLPLGTITGRFAGTTGPVSGTLVTATSRTDGVQVVTTTDADGAFVLRAFPGPYTMLFEPPPPGLPQWASGRESESAADAITVIAGQNSVLDERALPTGRVQGRLTDASGRGVMFAAVQLQDPVRGRFVDATTDGDGFWFAHPRAGTYRVFFGTAEQAQWAHGRLTAATADPVTVADGQTTTVDDVLLPTGSISVTAWDARTGTAVTSFCASATSGYVFQEVCTDDGSTEFPVIGQGTYRISVVDDVHLEGIASGVTVRAGQTSPVGVRLRLGGTVELSIVDATTGAPVESVCANTAPVDHPAGSGEGAGGCAIGGALTLDRVRPDRYHLLVIPFDGVHGAQWVGPRGGVGSPAAARIVTVQPGVTNRVTVRLDGRGSIAGVITDRATGAPVESAAASAWGVAVNSDADGRYRLDGLGPYDWTVQYTHNDYAWQWSGEATDSLTARSIRVRADRTATHDVRLRRGTTLRGTIIGPGGRAPDAAVVTVYNARSFDIVGIADATAGGRYSLRVLGPQDVRVEVRADFGGEPTVTTWYRDAADFAHADTVHIPASGTKVVNIPTG